MKARYLFPKDYMADPSANVFNGRLEVFDRDGTLLSSTNPIDVPIVRNKLTVVRGHFLTTRASGGIGVVTKFDGEYNYEVP